MKAELGKGPEAGTAKVTLSWDKPGDNVNCYAVYFSPKPGLEHLKPYEYWILVSGNSYVFPSDTHPYSRGGVRGRDLYFQVYRQ